MRRYGLALIAIPLLAAGVILAQRNVPQKHATIPRKHVDQSAPRVHLKSMHNGRQSLDDLYSSSDVPKTIPDLGYVTSTLEITDNVTIHDLNVHVVITHSWMRDLHVTLIGPDTTVRVTLFDLLPLDNAVNMDGWFDDGAGIPIAEADTPLVGTWQPTDSLGRFNGRSARGTWTLAILDTFPRDSGTLDAWGLYVNPPLVLQGTVQNGSTDAPVREARVEVLGTNYISRTNADGHYEFLRLDSSGIYTLRFTKAIRDSVPWYDTLTVNNISIQLGSTTVFDTLMTTLPGKYEFTTTVAPVQIPDADTAGGVFTVTPVTVPLPVDDNSQITDVNVLVNITHTWDSDLSFWLKSPAGDSIMLAKRVGGDGDNFIDCLFGDGGSTRIIDGSAPFTGFFRPENPLGILRDSSRTDSGIWTLTVVDSGPGDIGAIQNFTLEVTGLPVLAADPRARQPMPHTFTFEGNYPNPFNSQTEFRFDLARRGDIELVLYNELGQRVARIAQGAYDAGMHVKSFDARGLASGIYIARMTFNGSISQCRKVLLLR